MIVLNPSIVTKSNGLYALQAEENLKDLKEIMKSLIIKESPNKSAAIWAGEMSVPITNDLTKTADGGRVWAQTGVYRRNYVANKKRKRPLRPLLCNSPPLVEMTEYFFLKQHYRSCWVRLINVSNSSTLIIRSLSALCSKQPTRV